MESIECESRSLISPQIHTYVYEYEVFLIVHTGWELSGPWRSCHAAFVSEVLSSWPTNIWTLLILINYFAQIKRFLRLTFHAWLIFFGKLKTCIWLTDMLKYGMIIASKLHRKDRKVMQTLVILSWSITQHFSSNEPTLSSSKVTTATRHLLPVFISYIYLI